MPTVVFEANELGPEVRVEAPDGGRLLDLCDAARAPVAFACRGASCGTCRVEIVEGGELLEPPARDERYVLRTLGDPEGGRLACVARLRRAPGVVRIRVAVRR